MDNLLNLLSVLARNLGNELTMRQLAKESKVPYTTTHRLIEQNNELFIINPKGNIKLCSLNIKDELVKHYLILAERKHYQVTAKKQPLIKIITSELPKGEYTAILFGSRAEGNYREKSDFDICVINSEGKNLSLSRLEMLYKIEINILCFSKKEFSAMLQEKDHNVAKEILKKHIILKGEEYYWNLVWKNEIRQINIPRGIQKTA